MRSGIALLLFSALVLSGCEGGGTFLNHFEAYAENQAKEPGEAKLSVERYVATHREKKGIMKSHWERYLNREMSGPDKIASHWNDYERRQQPLRPSLAAISPKDENVEGCYTCVEKTEKRVIARDRHFPDTDNQF